ncbi:metalloregulator ArsR/SmtB family transcription factor [Microbacterium hydrocarbonoxydans]|uniref:metalloregulator ArsR/SmtB family transcription factor n=1 Tax=Microbacterium hydrocarbonoxydans TaxID=273678 RepID=UPI0007BAE392|nr:metalloregulator ArsR/SmtB family transcription factor [Microbacterium hydrocarbonoxydans]GAT72007.1 transcriptional regulator/arsenate reductase [Microbacterium sp. HM58-2]
MNALPAAPEQCSPVATHAIGQDAARQVAETLKALSDPLRLRMLSAIAADPRGESCVCDLAELSEVSQPTVSHHLKVLKEVEVLTSERRGTWVWYRINPGLRGAVTALLDSFAPATLAAPWRRDEPAGARPDFDARITRLAEELAAEIPELDRATVLGVVRESYTALARTAKATGALVPLTERFARQRLADLTRDRESSAPQVLFVCVANAGRSQLAAALVNRLANGKVVARSAGSSPADIIHPHVRSILAEIEGDRAVDRFPKPLTDDAVRAADVVVTMGCGDVCPVIPGVRYEDWAVGDPALASREGVEAIRDDIAARVRVLLDDLIR